MPSSRAQFVDVMGKFPQRCVITNYPNSNNQMPALDVGQDINGYGRIYVSDLGMKWLAEQFGYVHQEDAEKQLDVLRTQLMAAQEQISQLESNINKIPEAIEGVLNGLKQLSIDAVNHLVDVSNSVSDGDSSVDVEEADDSDEGSDKPVVVTARRGRPPTRK